MSDYGEDDHKKLRDTAEYRKIHDEALQEFDRTQKCFRDERLQCLQDRRFYSIAGAQWEGPLAQQFENKPKLEINKIHLAVVRIINEYRNNRISVNFVPKDGATGNRLSDTCNGLYRADEQDSTAEEAYDNSFEEAVGGGFGAFRYRADNEDETDDDDDAPQRIYIEPIFDADSSVYFDVDAKRQDKRDARKCWVLSSLSRVAYTEEYNDDPATWPKTVIQRNFDWLTPDIVYLAEYYKVTQKPYTLITFEGPGKLKRVLDKEELDEDSDLRKQLRETGFKKTGEKNKKRPRVNKYLMNGVRVLEDCGEIAGPNIPIVPVYGKRWFIDNIERCMGHVRLAKDVQRIKNMQMSKLAEISALSSIEKPIFTPEQMNGHAVMWQNDNIKNYPYLLLNSMTDDSGAPVANGPIGYTKSPEIPPAMAALLQIVDADMQAILGNQEAGEELQANLSGVAVELVQQKLDMQTYIYISNMAKAIKRGGEIWLGMAKEIYVEENRKKKTIDESGEVSSATLMQQNVDPDTGMPALTNDLSEADFDVTATPGPTSQSKRASTVRSLIALLGATQDPETMQVITSMIMMNMEGEGIDEIHDYFRTKLVRMGVIKPTPEEQQQMQQEQAQAAQQPPSPNDQFLQASAEQAKADAQLKQANTVNVAAQAELNKAKAMQILADIKAGNIDQAFKAIEAMQNNAMGQSEQQNAAAVTAANVDNTNAQTLNTHADTMHKHAQIAHTRAQVAHTHAQVAHTHANIANTDAQTTNTEAQTNAINNPEPEAAQ